MDAILKQVHFFSRNLSKPHKTQFVIIAQNCIFLKQGEIRARSGPITDDLIIENKAKFKLQF